LRRFLIVEHGYDPFVLENSTILAVQPQEAQRLIRLGNEGVPIFNFQRSSDMTLDKEIRPVIVKVVETHVFNKLIEPRWSLAYPVLAHPRENFILPHNITSFIARTSPEESIAHLDFLSQQPINGSNERLVWRRSVITIIVSVRSAGSNYDGG